MHLRNAPICTHGCTHGTHRINSYALRNERYCGDVRTRKRFKLFAADVTNQKTFKNRGEKPQSYYREEHDEIISRDDYLAVQRIMSNAKYGGTSLLPSLQVIPEGLLKGFVIVHPKWGSFHKEDYVQASESVDPPEEYLNAEKTMEARQGDFDLRGYEVVDFKLFDDRQVPSVALQKSDIKFNTSCIRRMNCDNHVELLIHPAKKQIAVRPSSKDDRCAIQWANGSGENRDNRSVACRAFIDAGYNVSGGSIVEYARQWIGKTKYIYGAGRNGPLDWQDYADCSSFVHGVFSHFGVEIGWTTVEQENSGTKVCENSLSKAEPGDIVLFYDGGSIRSGGSGHVGIYSGSGNMVHNSSSKGTVVEAPVSYQNRPYVVRRITIPFTEDRSGGGGNATKGHRKDPTNYSQSQLELIWAIVAQEDNGSYKGALAVISSAMNRTESSKWGYCGRTAMEQLTAPGQYCYSNDTYWMARLGGNVPDYVKTAVNDCLKKGIRNHNHTSFRSTKGKVTGPDAVQIGGNWFFDY